MTVVTAVVLSVAVIGMGVALGTTFSPARYASYLARWSYFAARNFKIRPGRAARILRVLTGGMIFVLGGVLGLFLAMRRYPDDAILPDAFLLATLAWFVGVLLTGVLSTVVALSGRPQALMIPPLRGLSVEEADRWVRTSMRLPEAWEDHMSRRRRR